MFKKLIASAILGASIVAGSLIGAGSASATGSYLVCVGIDEAPTYEAYIIDAAVWGKAFDWNTSEQAYNIVSAVNTYCPWHAPGLQAAAQRLSHSGSALV